MKNVVSTMAVANVLIIKTCAKCKKEKDITNFVKDKNRKDGVFSYCKQCVVPLTKKWNDENKNNEKFKQERLQYRQKNKNKKSIYDQQYRLKNLEKLKEKRHKYFQNNKTKEYEYIKRKRHKDINFKIANNIRTRTRSAIKEDFKTGSAVSDLGCSIEKLKQKLESMFYCNPKTGEIMSWNNYGRFGWHIDHIIPLSSFDLSNRQEFLKAVHFSNLQPLWFFENLSKGKKLLK